MPAWQGNLFIGGLHTNPLHRVSFDAAGTAEIRENLFSDIGPWVGDVRQEGGLPPVPAPLMNVLKQWIDQPRSVWLRRALFQIHLWIGLVLGLYIVMLSVTGSILVYRAQIVAIVGTPLPEFQPDAAILSEEEMKLAAQRVYPGYEIARIASRVTERRPAMSVRLESSDHVRDRLFNPYTGENLGDVFPFGVGVVTWVARLHDDLLLGSTGREINGIGGGVITILALTGAAIWWPGRRRWRQSMKVRWRTNWTRFNWDIHSALGFWIFAWLLIWAVSGVYLAFPNPFTLTVDYFSNPEPLRVRLGDLALEWLARLHFGRFRTQPALQAAWAVLGLVPSILFVTGSLMWWNRVLKKVPGVDREPAPTIKATDKPSTR